MTWYSRRCSICRSGSTCSCYVVSNGEEVPTIRYQPRN